jgi:23S rRNA pseudouridine1911/1915/1917 synthase
MQYTVQESMTLLQALKQMAPDSSNRTLQNWLKAEVISIDGIMEKKGNTLLEKETVVLRKSGKKQTSYRGVRILHEDRRFFIIDKPAGLLSVGTSMSDDEDLLGYLKDYTQSNQVFAVHRLDRDTSGVMVYARGQEAETAFKSIFAKHDIVREYFAIVEGNVPDDEGTWKSRLIELENLFVKSTTTPGEGREAITHYKVERRSDRFSYLNLRLETGRKHQIRVHCQEAGFPVTGDKRYNSAYNPIKRMALHAVKLEFVDPFTKKLHSFESPPPRPFKLLGA